MTFASEAAKQSTCRAAFVRLMPTFNAVPGLASIGGGVYSMTFTQPIAGVKRNGTSLTYDGSSGSPGTNDRYTFDETTSTFKVKLAAAPSSTTNVVIISYYILLSTETAMAGLDPSSETQDRVWEPRLIGSPEVTQSASDVVNGVFSLSGGGISVANADRWFNQFLSPNDSYSKADVAIWFSLNETVRRVFLGTVSGIRLGSDAVDIDFSDGFANLQRPAYMGDTYQEAYFLRESGSFPNMDPAKAGAPCRYVVGWSSRYQQSDMANAMVTKADTPGAGDQLDSCYEDAVCTDFTQSIGTSNNRVWGLCRIPTGKLKAQTFGSISRVAGMGSLLIDGNYVQTFYVYFTGHSLKVGERVKWTESAVVYYGYVTFDSAFTYSGDSYNCTIFGAGLSAAMTTSSAFTSQSGVALHWYDSSASVWRPMYSTRDYTTSVTATSGGNDYVKVTLVNNFESAWSAAAIDPTSDKLKYLVFLDNPADKHGEVLTTICQKAGLAVSTSTFTAANAALAADCMFTIPECDETDYRTYLEYAQEILAATLGILAINDSAEVEYHLLDAPSSSDSRDSNLCLEGSVECDFNYADIITELVAYNPHNQAQRVLDDTSGPAVSRRSNLAKYLHGLTRSEKFRHPLEKIGARIDAIINLRSQRRALYKFKTATLDLTTELGDDVQLETNLGGSTSTDDLTVVGYTRSLNDVTVTASDLEGL